MNYSIIIPYSDTPELLLRAIQSIPDRADIEVLVVDNGKKPLDVSILTDRKNVQVLHSPVGEGAGRARNEGLKHIQGTWLLLLDADDYFTETAFDTMDQHLHSSADIIFYYLDSCYSDTKQPATRHIGLNKLIDQYKQTCEEGILRYGWASPCGKMIRTQLIQEHSIVFEETQVANDVMFSLLTGYYAGSIDAVTSKVYCATLRDGSLTTAIRLDNLAERIEVSARYNQFVKTHHLSQYQKSIMYYIYTANKQYGLKAAIRLLWHSIKLGNNPFVGWMRWTQTVKNR